MEDNFPPARVVEVGEWFQDDSSTLHFYYYYIVIYNYITHHNAESDHQALDSCAI